MKELWKDIKGYEGLYQVSNKGRVKSLERYNSRNYLLKGRFMKPCLERSGYYCIPLRKNGKAKTFRVHRLVCSHFVKNFENKPCVNHLDGIKTNNCFINLEWCTYSENIKHSYKLGFHKILLGEKNVRSKLTNADIRIIRKSNLSCRVLGRKFNTCSSNIYNIKNHKIWKHIK